MSREMVITFEVLSFCRNQDGEDVWGEKVVELFVRDQWVADQSAEVSRPGNNEGVKSRADILEAEKDEGGYEVPSATKGFFTQRGCGAEL